MTTDAPNPYVYDPVDWDSVDWRKSPTEIAQEHNVSRQRVHQKRPKDHPYQRPEVRHNATREALSKLDIEALTTGELSARLGVSPGTVRRHLKVLERAPRDGRVRYDWREVDWRYTNRTIAQREQVHQNYVSQKRSEYAPEQLKSSPGKDPE